METIDWINEDTKNSLMAYFLLESMTQKGIEHFKGFDSTALEVSMQVNGIDVSFTHVMGLIQNQLNDMGAEERQKGYEKALEDAARSIELLSDSGC